ncbi:MAG: phospho-N-acetylmuramoyl-pentapeptide-transferase, partial [Bacteroidetes bacterium]
MIYSLVKWLEAAGYHFPGIGLWNYITFRAGVAIIISLIISLLFGGKIIQFLKRLQVGETIRDLGLEGQKEKEGTPTMGGVIIIMAIVIPCLLVADLENIYILLMLLATTWMGIIGFTDDYIKVFRKNKDGLSGKFKVLGQIGLGTIVALTMLVSDDVVVRMDQELAAEKGYEIVKTFEVPDDKGIPVEVAYVKTTLTNIPFLKGNDFDYCQLLWFLGDNAARFVWIVFIPLIIFIVTA